MPTEMHLTKLEEMSILTNIRYRICKRLCSMMSGYLNWEPMISKQICCQEALGRWELGLSKTCQKTNNSQPKSLKCSEKSKESWTLKMDKSHRFSSKECWKDSLQAKNKVDYSKRAWLQPKEVMLKKDINAWDKTLQLQPVFTNKILKDWKGTILMWR